MAIAEPIKIVIDDDDELVRVDPDTGTIETINPDGSVDVKLDAAKPPGDNEEDEWFGNLLDKIPSIALSNISSDLIEGIKADDKSREGYLQTLTRGMDLLGLKLEQPKGDVGESSSGSDGMSSVTNPLLLEACLKGWANAQAELLPASGPAKIKDDGDESAQDDEQAEYLERGFNHYLTVTAAEYYPSTSKMLLWGVYFAGSGFKKIYRCPLRRRPVSDAVNAKQLIVSDTTDDLRACGRITHEIPMRPSVMKRMKMIGAYKGVKDLPQPQGTPNVIDNKIASIQGTTTQQDRPEDRPYIIWESQCELVIDDFAPSGYEGIPLPYLVTIDKDSEEILAIRRDWKEDDDQCERIEMYVKYPYVPGPGFYGTGMLNILGNASAAMTAAWREALDTGMYANFPAGLIAKLGSRQNSSTFRLAPGEFEAIETNGQPISSVAMGLPFKDVTPGLLSLIDKITAQAEKLGGAADIPAAEGLANVPVGTMLAQIEQATKVMAAAHKGMHTAQAKEFQLLIELFRAHPEDFWRHNKEDKAFWNEEKLIAALDNVSLVPVADPNVPSHIHRVAKALALVQLIALPTFAPLMDPLETLKRIFAAMREDPTGIIRPQAPAAAPPPDPNAMAKVLDSQTKQRLADSKIQVDQSKIQTDQAKIQTDAQSAQADVDDKTLDLTKELIIHNADQRKIDVADQRNQIQATRDSNRADSELDLKHKQHDLEVQKHGLASASAGHEAGLGLAQHALATEKEATQAALNVHEALNPPKPAAPAKPKATPAKGNK